MVARGTHPTRVAHPWVASTMRRGRREVGARACVVDGDAEGGVVAAVPPLAQAVDAAPSRPSSASAATKPQLARRMAAAARLAGRSLVLTSRRRVSFLTSMASAL